MKKVLYVILGLIALYLILALFGKSRVVVERSTIINQPSDVIKKQLGDLKYFQEKWSPWTEHDPKMVPNYTGNTGEVGHSMSWKSDVKEVGQGTLTITGFNGDSILQRLSFEGMGDTKCYYIVKQEGNASTVVWGMDNQIGFFFRPIMMFMNMDNMIGPDYEKGLANFKKLMESAPAASSDSKYEVKEIEWPETYYVGTKLETMDFSQITTFFGTNYAKIAAELGKNKIEPTAAPMGIYTNFDEATSKATLAAVFKIAEKKELKGFELHTLPAGKVLHIQYYGDYAKSANAHYAMDAFMKEKSLTQSHVLEEYVTDPMVEKDTAKWLTNIYYIVK